MSTSGLAIENIFRGLTHWLRLEEHEVLSNFNTCRMWIYWGQKQPKEGGSPRSFWEWKCRLKNPGRECRYQILRQPHINADVKTTVQIKNPHPHHRRRHQHYQRCCWPLQEIEISQPNHSCLWWQITIHHHASGVMRPGGLTPVTSRTSILRSQDLSHRSGEYGDFMVVFLGDFMVNHQICHLFLREKLCFNAV